MCSRRLIIHKFSLSAFIFLFFAVLPVGASAQNFPGDQPGAQSSRFKAASEEEKKRLEKEAVKKPRIEFEKEKPAPSPAAGPAFVLNKIKITGAVVFSIEDFIPDYRAFLGKQITFVDLDSISASIKARYKRKGYLSTDVYIPEQDVAQGEVEIRVVEGKLGDVTVEGNKWFSGALLRKYIHMKKDDILDFFKLQKDMLRLNQNPDMEVTAVVSPGKETASTDLTLKVKDNRPYHFGSAFDNQGTRLVGRTRNSFFFRSTNLSGLNDLLSVNILMSKSSEGEFLSYCFPLDTYGTKAGIDLTIFDMELGREYAEQHVRGKTQILTPHISSELSLSEDFQAYSDIGMDIKSIIKRTAGELTLDDQIRMPYAALDFTGMDRIAGGGQTVFSPRVSFSTKHFLGASSRGHPSAGREDTGGFFCKYEQALKRIQRAPWGSYVTARSQFQTASHTLPSSEQLQLGGLNSVRGYPEGEYLADLGAILNLEWFFPFYPITEKCKLPGDRTPLRNQLQPVIFLDMGRGKLMKAGLGEDPNRFLMGAGCGLRFQYNKNFFIRMDWAKHFGDSPTQGQGPSTFYISTQCEI